MKKKKQKDKRERKQSKNIPLLYFAILLVQFVHYFIFSFFPFFPEQNKSNRMAQASARSPPLLLVDMNGTICYRSQVSFLFFRGSIRFTFRLCRSRFLSPQGSGSWCLSNTLSSTQMASMSFQLFFLFSLGSE